MIANDQLVNLALARATGANIHNLKGLICFYRSFAGAHPEMALLYERVLEVFVATGDLELATASVFERTDSYAHRGTYVPSDHVKEPATRGTAR